MNPTYLYGAFSGFDIPACTTYPVYKAKIPTGHNERMRGSGEGTPGIPDITRYLKVRIRANPTNQGTWRCETLVYPTHWYSRSEEHNLPLNDRWTLRDRADCILRSQVVFRNIEETWDSSHTSTTATH